MVKKSTSFTQDEFEAIEIVATYQHRTTSGYIRHCVNIETTRRLKKILNHLDDKPTNTPWPEGESL